MLDEFGCDNTLRWARHWRDVCAPRATGLERRLGAKGGYCDCEILLNVYRCRRECKGVSRRGSTKPCTAR